MKNTRKKTKYNLSKIIFYFALYISLVLIGFILGMFYQQIVIIEGVGKVLSYTNVDIDVNFNATEFSNELNRTFIPSFREALNQTIQGKLK